MSSLRGRFTRLALPLCLAWAASASFCEGEDAAVTPINDQTPPTVTILDVVQTGSRVDATVRAQDGISLTSLTVEVNIVQGGTETLLDSRTFNFSGVVKDTTFTATFTNLSISAGENLRIRARAVDGNQNAAVATFSTVVGLQAVDLIQPGDSSSLPVGDSVLTATQLADPAGIVALTLVGRTIRGEIDFGTDTTVIRYGPKTVNWDPPITDTTIFRWLRPTPDITSEEVYFVALAENASGRVLADSNLTSVGGPLVEILSPSQGQSVLVNSTLDVRIHVSDTEPLLSAGLSGSGVLTFDTTVNFAGAVFDTTFIISRTMPATSGDLVLVARAVNADNVLGRSGSVTVRVGTAAPADTVRPEVTYTFDNRPRLEVDDQIRVTVTVQDPLSGVRSAGVSVLSNNGGVRDSAIFRVDYATTRTGTVVQDFFFPPFNFNAAALPDSVTYEFHAFAHDAANPRNCGAAATAGQTQSLVCDSLSNPSGLVLAAGATGTTYSPMIVAGQTIESPRQGSVTPDLVVDTTRQLLFVSNKSFNQVDVFNLATGTFGTPIAVGSEPWGMMIGNSGDTLFVANSGGTNLSKVSLLTLTEVTGERIFTPNNSIFKAEESQTETGAAIVVTLFDYSDRPQFIAQAADVGVSRGVILFSTVPTESAPDGTVREFDTQFGDVRFFVDYAAGEPSVDTKNIQIVNADDAFSTGDQLFVCDHDRGSTTTTCFSVDVLADAIDSVAARPLWDTEIHTNLSLEDVGLQDTTFVAASGNRQFVAIGEGATGSRPGRIMMYQASDSTVSDIVEVEDLIGNASEPVLGLALNFDGSLGAARGEKAYFFDSGLRLQGLNEDVSVEGTGAAFHPDYANAKVADDARQLAFLGSSDGRIDVIDTFHFCRRGTLFIRDAIAGPVRTSRRFAADPLNVIVKVYAMTTTGVVVVNVLDTDITASCQP